ncbi:hypothetical protein [Catellatospora chokoriensis]|uniref:Uncharacterized protein n=1 Tax=Catellatospora chokoriensis TaxID=310353 RepID=A0A8J3K0U4_9ACTN|nr:hypothetical protein [Catellatospora chokoriensis]GIF90397.1 hypothetical protein Cch02nite_38410 [Catellatospora chokoriensis]
MLDLIERERKDALANDENFSAMPADEVERRLATSTDPFLTMYGWRKGAPPGGKLDLRLFIHDSVEYPTPKVFVHVWVGSGNIDSGVDTFLANVDSRFPRLTRPEYPGLAEGDPHKFPLPPGIKRLDFELALPAPLEESVYLGNICLMQLDNYAAGRMFGRGVFPFAVRAIFPLPPPRR